jgi:hypothetical protein
MPDPANGNFHWRIIGGRWRTDPNLPTTKGGYGFDTEQNRPTNLQITLVRKK